MMAELTGHEAGAGTALPALGRGGCEPWRTALLLKGMNHWRAGGGRPCVMAHSPNARRLRPCWKTGASRVA
eukprot:363580-Chlamydomonas_euryale.AAC.5